jgi:hypothetical protein
MGTEGLLPVQKRLPLFSISEPDDFCKTATQYFYNISFNIIFPNTPWCPEWCVSFCFLIKILYAFLVSLHVQEYYLRINSASGQDRRCIV